MDEMRQLFEEAYYAAWLTVHMIEKDPHPTASTIQKIRMESEKATAKLTALEERLKGNPAPKSG